MKKPMISVPFFLLRAGTAGAALVTGLLQTFVFAHVLTPQRFSLFIIVAAIGYSLWLIDFGIVKILFVRLRARFLARERMDEVASHATAVLIFYSGLVAGSSFVCFVFMAAPSGASLREAAEFGLFFLFVSLNLTWFALRNIAIAVDEYVLFEALETARRAGYFVGLAALYIGMPMLSMLVALNVLWAIVLFVCIKRMIARHALVPRIRGFAASLLSFFRANRAELARSGTYAASDIYIYNFPYLIVTALFGLGAPPIILDTTFKVFRGGAMVFGAVCDILVPRQTSALAERDGPTLLRATLIAAGLCAIPAAIAGLILVFAGEWMFATLLGKAATMPPATIPILLVLIAGNLVYMVTQSVLVHNGYFRDVARLGLCNVAAMTCVGALAVFAHLDIVGFLEAYAAVYAGGALGSLVIMIRGPIRLAYDGDAGKRATPPISARSVAVPGSR